MSVTLFFELYAWFAAALLGVARLAPIFFMLPFLNSGVLTGMARQTVIVLVSLGFLAYVGVPTPALDSVAFLGLMLREASIGMLLGVLLCWPFWVLHAMGNLIDNQRGAMLSSTVDPANGVDTSELANFLQLFAAVVYLEGGGMLLMLETVGHSYRICAPTHGCEAHWPVIMGLLDALVSKTLVISAPVVAALLISEALLGLLSRYAPQMNAFSVSLTVKSLVALVVLMLYFGVHLPDEVLRMGRMSEGLAPYLGDGEGRDVIQRLKD
ncbi:type III secretion system export apparatus subunit SctT [Pseudomonas sp. St316]|uniref:type III secretion system export apparatus subunit SctT n=1 Tax=Pseudomonas sp. St316 TaxID=2678257 RepID=UPI001BB445EF|nr:type III secretion system export apparatus subunit SctT [Pseudomonas sp. St316]BBP60582.1 type III secretion system protein SpaR [Pseudomonas sp. St316]